MDNSHPHPYFLVAYFGGVTRRPKMARLSAPSYEEAARLCFERCAAYLTKPVTVTMDGVILRDSVYVPVFSRTFSYQPPSRGSVVEVF